MNHERLISFVCAVARVLRPHGLTAVIALNAAKWPKPSYEAQIIPKAMYAPIVGNPSPQANVIILPGIVPLVARTRRRNGGSEQRRPSLWRVPPLNSRVAGLVLLAFLAFLMTGCVSVAVGSEAQSNNGSIVANAEEGGTAVIGVGNDVHTAVEPTQVESGRYTPMIGLLAASTGLAIGVVYGLYKTTRGKHEKQPNFD